MSRKACGRTIDNYEDIECIGEGAFGQVFKVKRIEDGKVFARKEVDFKSKSPRDRRMLVSEVNIMRHLKHDNIINYVERYVDQYNG